MLPQIWFETSFVAAFREEAPNTRTFYLDDGPFQIDNYYLSVQTHETAWRTAGFREIWVHRSLLSPQAEAADGRDYWSDLPEHPPLTFIECST